jgi:hypothetical protein
MGVLDETRYVERPQFFNGERLFAEDLQGLEGFNREMRWLHNRSLHQPGIGNGFAVRGRKGDRTVTVEPGYAIDAQGREIVLVDTEELDVPPVAGESDGSAVFYDLAILYPDDATLEVVETRAGVCAPRGVVRLREKPVFCWVRLKRTEAGSTATAQNGSQIKESLAAADARLRAAIEQGMFLVLARAEVLNCQLNQDLSIAERRNARPSLGPHIACGEESLVGWPVVWWINDPTAALQTILNRFFAAATTNASRGTGFSLPTIGRGELLLHALGPVILPLGLEATVPTGAACFRAAPHYMARLGGKRMLTLDLNTLLQALNAFLRTPDGLTAPTLSKDANSQWELYCEGLVSVLDPQPEQFTARVAVMVQLLDVPTFELSREASGAIGQWLPTTILGEKLAECGQLAGEEQSTCIAAAAQMAAELGQKLVVDLLRNIVKELEWRLIWMGVEG